MEVRNAFFLCLLAALALCACEKSKTRPAPTAEDPGPAKPEVGHAQGLENASAMIENAKRCEPKSGEGSVSACERACELNHSNSCANWGHFLVESDSEAAAKLFRRSCVGGSGIGCEAEARASQLAKNPDAEQQFRNARNYHRVHCSQGYARSCSQLAALHAEGLGGAADAKTAQSFRERACLLGRVSDC